MDDIKVTKRSKKGFAYMEVKNAETFIETGTIRKYRG